MNFQRFTLLLIAMMASFINLYAEETNDKTHQIQTISFDVEGITSEKALLGYIDIKVNQEFKTEKSIREAAEREQQRLVNYRVFKDVQLLLTKDSEDDTTIYWNIQYAVVDSWTLIPIPYPNYNSNTGFRFGLKTYYDNAFGTMTNAFLGMSLDIRRNEKTRKVEIGEWAVTPAWSGIRIGPLDFRASITQQFSEEEFNDEETPEDSYNYSYYQTVLSFGSSIDLPGEWYYSFTPTFSMRYGYNDVLGNGNFRMEPFNFAWSHSGGWSLVDWTGNFRKGISTSLGHTLRYIYDPSQSKNILVNDISASASYYLPFFSIFNYYTHFSAFATFNDRRSGVGSSLRGIADDSMSGQYGMVLNNSLAIQFWRWEGVWDAQAHPFFDIGFAVPESGFLASRDIRYSAGIDFVLYLDALPSLVARGSIGVDLTRHAWSDFAKYEIDISSSLSY